MSFQEKWKIIKEQALDRVVSHLENKQAGSLFTPTSYLQVYTLAYQLCPGEPQKEQQLNDAIASYLSDYLQLIVSTKFSNLSSRELLSVFHTTWTNYLLLIEWYQKFFCYLERYGLKDARNIKEFCITKFYRHLTSPLQTSLLLAASELATSEYSSEDLELLGTLYQVLSLTGQYKQLQKALIEGEKFKSLHIKSKLENTCLESKLIEIEKYLRKVKQTYNICLEHDDKLQLKHIVLDILLSEMNFNKAQIVSVMKSETLYQCLEEIFTGRDLSVIQVPYHDYICEELASYLHRGNQEIKALCEFYVNETRKRQNSQLPELVLTIDRATVNTLNKENSVDVLVKYIDSIIKTSCNDLELENFIRVFAKVSDKDYFREKYCELLTKRLLSKPDLDLETTMVNYLKQACGSSYVTKIEGMIKDIKYGCHVLDETVNVKVLTQGFWSEPPQFNMSPNILQPYMDAFETQFTNMFSSRRLNWKLWYGTLQIKAYFKDKVYDLTMSTAQGLLLLAISQNPGLSVNQISYNNRIDKITLKPLLHSLTLAKVNILKKTGGNKINDDDLFTVNDTFEYPTRQIRFSVPVVDISKTCADLEISRQNTVDACIIRIMKSRKTLLHNDLLAVVSQEITLFKPSVNLIKKRISHLIEQDYLERDKSELNRYHYLA